MNKLKILEETVDYYKIHPRGLNDSGECCYYDKNTGNRCAIGRLLTIEQAKDVPSNGSIDVDDMVHDYLVSCNPTLFNGENIRFLSDLQRFHDNETLWDSDGAGNNKLTQSGEKEYLKLKRRYRE